MVGPAVASGGGRAHGTTDMSKKEKRGVAVGAARKHRHSPPASSYPTHGSTQQAFGAAIERAHASAAHPCAPRYEPPNPLDSSHELGARRRGLRHPPMSRRRHHRRRRLLLLQRWRGPCSTTGANQQRKMSMTPKGGAAQPFQQWSPSSCFTVPPTLFGAVLVSAWSRTRYAECGTGSMRRSFVLRFMFFACLLRRSSSNNTAATTRVVSLSHFEAVPVHTGNFGSYYRYFSKNASTCNWAIAPIVTFKTLKGFSERRKYKFAKSG